MISRKSMKWTVTAMLVLCLSLLISACQTSSSPGNHTEGDKQAASEVKQPEQATNAQETTNVEEVVETRMYTHKYGETEIPVEPKRVVTAYHLGHMLALDVRPLGAATFIIQYSEHAMDTTGVADLGVPLNLERIAELEPDLIVLIEAYLDPSGGYEAFKAIAPTVVIDVHQDPVKDIRIIADLLNKQEAAEQWVTAYEQKIADTKEVVQQHFGSEETFTILNVRSEKNFKIYRNRNLGGNVLYESWGLKPQEKVLEEVINGIEGESSYMDITEEMIPSFIGDHVILASSYVDEENISAIDDLLESGLWKNLDAVKNNRIYRINFDEFLFNDPLSAMKQIDELVKALTENN